MDGASLLGLKYWVDLTNTVLKYSAENPRHNTIIRVTRTERQRVLPLFFCSRDTTPLPSLLTSPPVCCTFEGSVTRKLPGGAGGYYVIPKGLLEDVGDCDEQHAAVHSAKSVRLTGQLDG